MFSLCVSVSLFFSLCLCLSCSEHLVGTFVLGEFTTMSEDPQPGYLGCCEQAGQVRLDSGGVGDTAALCEAQLRSLLDPSSQQ